MGIKVMHLADIHLGMENYGRPDPKTGLNSRLVDFLNSFDQAVEFALAESVDLVVFAGDAFKNRDPNPTLQREFARRIKRLASAAIPVVLLVGNHDIPNSENKAHALEIYRTLAVDNVYVARRPEVLTVPTAQGVVQVACLPYLTRSSLLAKDDYKGLSLEELDAKLTELLSLFITRLAGELDPALPNLLLAHISVANAVLGSEKSIMVGKDAVLPLSSVALPQFDYVALGHIHRHQSLADLPPVVYAGSLDRIDFGEERQAKGFVLVDLVKGAATYRFHKLNTRPFLTVELTLTEQEPTEEVLLALRQLEMSEAVVRINLNLSAEQAALLRLDELNRYLQHEAYYLAGVNRQISGTMSGVRSVGLTEQVGPLDALKLYLDLQPEQKDAEMLLAFAQGLVKELEEAL